MLNRKDLLGGVMLGAVLSCVLFVGALTAAPGALVTSGKSADESTRGSGDAPINGAEQKDGQR